MDDWKRISEYPDYEINSNGEVRNTNTNRVLKPIVTRKGYCHVSLANERGRKHKLVHRLVATEFIRPPKDNEEVNHIDGIKTNNNVANLEWCTSSENQRHAYSTGLQKPIRSQIEYSLSRSHEAHKKAVVDIETGEKYSSIIECANAVGLSKSAVSLHALGKVKNRRFRYAEEGG